MVGTQESVRCIKCIMKQQLLYFLQHTLEQPSPLRCFKLQLPAAAASMAIIRDDGSCNFDIWKAPCWGRLTLNMGVKEISRNWGS